MLQCVTCGKDLTQAVTVLGDEQLVIEAHVKAHRVEAISRAKDMAVDILGLLSVINPVDSLVRIKVEGIINLLSTDIRFSEG